MLIDFFYHLRAHRLPVSVKEYLTLVDALRHGLGAPEVESFYFLARSALVKDESLFDKYDQAFGLFYKKIQASIGNRPEVPPDWLMNALKRTFTAEEKEALEKHGWDELMKRLEERLKEQKGRHAGGNKWIGTGGTSPFGHSGYHPEGIRIGGPSAGHRTAVKVWETREFKDYDDQVQLGTRSFKVALRRLRRFARDSADMELDLDGTIAGTARNAGHLDLKMVTERRNAVKVLMLLDVGGSMDDHITQVEELFSAARSEFRHLEVYYFHNCPYESLWRANGRRHSERLDTWDVLRKYNADWRVIFVGDATMSPYEILQPGGSVEHYNKESGADWMTRILDTWPKSVWLNPEPSAAWQYRQSIALMRDLMGTRMYPVTVAGIESAMRTLVK